ncbi:PREDICTED: inositol 1,4,5-trisphosphate receptor-interacting protein-like 1, partial [Phaethon lepturus]|uniref:inositol 1,4,5-trisphosphate receptor-interacting protein-like 1 n=1 Tax=Phaethon lepturus TaxID=97097 RepID=UPI000530513A
MQQWQFWAAAGVLVLLFGLCWWLITRSHEVDSSSEEESDSSSEEEISSSSTEQEEEEEQEQEESEGEDPDNERDLGRIFAKRIKWPVQNLVYRRRVVEELVGHLFREFQVPSSNTFFPVLQPAIGVDSTFEGWSPCEDDAVYRLLVPLQPPRGHVLHLEMGTVEERPVRNSRLRVELECTCTKERIDMLCFLH